MKTDPFYGSQFIFNNTVVVADKYGPCVTTIRHVVQYHSNLKSPQDSGRPGQEVS